MITINQRIVTIWLLLMFGFASVGSAQTTLRLAFQLPLNHHLSQNIILFKNEVENRSNGRIIVELRDYGSFLEKKTNNADKIDEKAPPMYFQDGEIGQAVSGGLIEAGLVSLPRFVKTIPLADIFYQPFLLDTKRKIQNTVSRDSPVRKAIESSIANMGSTVLWWQSYGSVVLVSKGEPIQNPGQIKDKRVRVFGETLGHLVLAAGGIPKAISNSKQYFAYRHRKVDLGMTTVADIRRNKIWDVMDTVSITNNASVQFIIVVNSRWWNNLNQFNKNIISDAAFNAEKRSIDAMKKIEADSYKEILQNGMKLVVLSDDDRGNWKERSEPIYRKFLERTGEQGMELFLLINNF